MWGCLVRMLAYQRWPPREIVTDWITAPRLRARQSGLVDECTRREPRRGTMIRRYPASGRMLGFLTSWWMRKLSRLRCLDLNRGRPTRRPFRLPVSESSQFFQARSASAKADWKV